MPERFWKENNTGLVRSEAELLRWWEAGAAGWQTFPIWLKWHFTPCDAEGKPVVVTIKSEANYTPPLTGEMVETKGKPVEEPQPLCMKCGKYPAEKTQTICEFCLGISKEEPATWQPDEKLVHELFDILDDAYSKSAGIDRVANPPYRFNVEAGISAMMDSLHSRGWLSLEESEHLRNNLDNALLELEEKPYRFTDADLKAVKRETAIKSWYLMSSNADYHLREVFLKAIGLE